MSAAKLLVIALSNIGDAVMCTPVLEALHRQFPEAVIDILADPRSSELFRHCPYRGAILHKQKRAGWRETLKLVRELRRTRYQLIADLRTDGLAYLLRAERRYIRKVRSELHAVEQHIDTIIPVIGSPPSIPPTCLWLGEEERTFAAQVLATLPGTRWLAVAPGANWPPKIWPVLHWPPLFEQVRDHFEGIILLGGRGDLEAATTLTAMCPLPCLNLAGCTGLLQAAAVLKQATAFVGNDSGLGHIAAAMDTPTLTLFGPGQPQRFRPWGARVDWLAAPSGSIADLEPIQVAERLITLLNAS